MNLSILFTSGPIDNTNFILGNVEVRVRNTDPSNSASVTVRLLDESLSPEALIDSDSFIVNASRTESELYSVAALSSFLIEVEIDLANRSDVITATAVQPTVTAFNGSSEFDQFIRLMVSSPEVLQDINYPVTPQLNLILPETAICSMASIMGDVSLNNIPQAGIDISFTADTSGVSFMPNPATTDMNGEYVTSIVVTSPKGPTNTAITASATVDGQSVQSVGVTEVECLPFEIYVTNNGSNDVSVIDTVTNMVVDTITGITNPTGIAANSLTDLVYVANNNSFLSVIDGTTNVIINTITAGINVIQFGVDVNESENLIFLANNGGPANTVTIVDGTSNVIIDTVTVTPQANGVAVDQQRNLTYVTSAFTGFVSVIDGDNGFVITATITVGGSPRGLEVNESTNTIYVALSSFPLVSVIDGDSFLLTSTISVGIVPLDVALNENTNLIYVTNQGSGNISVIDGNLDVVTATITVGIGSGLSAITLIEDSNTIYVANTNSNNVSVIDGDTNMVITTITVGGSPLDITFL
ncbi:YncE family protein [Bacillus carboniphilus]|uniref:YncE family protein n=1 Tax=Bacillus carboniphilus TaxID=86663 RepID=A0ABY9JXV5_9BACI|nr:YncE family protein [Bacillus carboniphilus]WLR42481.1 YncE family protein [Bacillus carboniphilus]